MNTKKLTWTVAAIALTLAPAAVRSQTLSFVTSTDITTQFSPAFYEASGLGLTKDQTALWSISDSNFTIYKLSLTGSALTSFIPVHATGVSAITNTDFEGVTAGPPLSGSTSDTYIYLANENDNSILPVNYSSQKYHAPAPLSGMSGYTSVNCGDGHTVEQDFANAGNSGLEGITWDGTYFFVIKEKDPGLILKISSDLTQILACKTLSLPNATDYSDISYDSTRGKFWIASDEADNVYLYDWSTNSMVKGWHFTIDNMEGISFNPANNRLYIATDNGNTSDSYLYTYNVQ